jgi:phage major head subunit gpT-like protein
LDPTPSNLQIFFTGLSTAFHSGYMRPGPWWNNIAMSLPSDTELTTHGWMDRIPKMREWVGPRTVNALPSRTQTVRNKDWEETESIPRNKFLDDTHGLYTPLATDMGWQAAKLHDQQLALAIQANPTCFDGAALFSTAHPIDPDGELSTSNQSNELATTALTPSGYGTGRATMRGLVGRDGQPMGSMPTLLVVPPQLEEAGRLILTADFYGPKSFGNMTDNVGTDSNIWKGTAELLVVEELANQPKVWYLFDNSMAMRAFLVQIRQPAQFTYLVNPNDPNVFWQKEYVFGADSRSAYAPALWFKALRAGASL